MNVVSYSADEILGTAIEIEINASRYYRDGARAVDQESPMHSTFLELSDMEQNHARTFTALRQELTEDEKRVQSYDPGNEMLYYLRGMAGLHGWEGKAGPHARLTGRESVEEVLTTALNAERETVYFYNFLKVYIPAGRGREKVEMIIGEEMRHVAIINRYLAEMQGD